MSELRRCLCVFAIAFLCGLGLILAYGILPRSATP